MTRDPDAANPCVFSVASDGIDAAVASAAGAGAAEGVVVTGQRRTLEDSPQRSAVLHSLVELSRELGSPERDAVILAEGNTSGDIDGKTFLLKASGFSLVTATEESFVEMRTAAVLDLLDRPPRTDAELTTALLACRAADGPRPSTEATLHALALTLGGARFVGHSHPTAVNAILCSKHARALAAGTLFPDHIVVCGRALLVPYVDPGVPLGVAVREGLRKHIELHGSPPKVIYLQNHGLIALGHSPSDVLQVTAMAVKVARVLLGTFAAGGPQFLADSEEARIETRPDEHYRQQLLAKT